MSFVNQHTQAAKRAVVTALYKRKDYIYKGTAARKKEEELILSELSANGYPEKFVKKTAKLANQRKYTKPETERDKKNHRNCNHSVHRRDQ